jgi:hypothetical protein
MANSPQQRREALEGWFNTKVMPLVSSKTAPSIVQLSIKDQDAAREMFTLLSTLDKPIVVVVPNLFTGQRLLEVTKESAPSGWKCSIHSHGRYLEWYTDDSAPWKKNTRTIRVFVWRAGVDHDYHGDVSNVGALCMFRIEDPERRPILSNFYKRIAQVPEAPLLS